MGDPVIYSDPSKGQLGAPLADGHGEVVSE
jgi:hypothetical protein